MKTGHQIADDINRLLHGEKVGEALFGVLLVAQSVLASCSSVKEAEGLLDRFFDELDKNFPKIEEAIKARIKDNAPPQIH